MNVKAPVSSIMTKDLITVGPKDSLSKVQEIFEGHNIHHLPVVEFKKIVGIVSKTDFMAFLRGAGQNEMDRLINETRLRSYKAEDIMTHGLAKLEPDDRINVALDIFKMNRFHALPVVQDNELVGIITTHDIIRALAEE